MRYLIPMLALMLAGCPTISGKIDNLTGSTLEERCGARRAVVAAYDARATDLSETEMRIRMDYQLFIDAVCPLLPAPE